MTTQTASASLILWCSTDYFQYTDDAGLNDWWTNQHLPERLSIPGFIRARRYHIPNTSEKYERDGKHYLARYDVSSLAILKSEGYIHALNNPTPETKLWMPQLLDMQRYACEVVLSKRMHSNEVLGNWMVSWVLPTEGRLSLQIFQRMWEACDRNGTFCGMECLLVDGEVTALGSASKAYEGVGFEGSHYGVYRETHPPGSPTGAVMERENSDSGTRAARFKYIFLFDAVVPTVYAEEVLGRAGPLFDEREKMVDSELGGSDLVRVSHLRAWMLLCTMG